LQSCSSCAFIPGMFVYKDFCSLYRHGELIGMAGKSRSALFYGLQVLTIKVCDSHITGRPAVGYVKFPLTRMPQDGCLTAWLPVQVQHSSEVYTIGMKATMMG